MGDLTATMLDDTAKISKIGRRSLINRQVETARMLELRHAEALDVAMGVEKPRLVARFFRVLTDWTIFFGIIIMIFLGIH